MRIALVSLRQLWEDKKGNQDKCRFISESICRDFDNVDLIIYPEMTLTGFSVTNSMLAEPVDNAPSISFFKQLASNTRCGHIFGFSARDEQSSYFNRCCYIDNEGYLATTYDKMHTFSFAGENKLYSRGEAPAIAHTKTADIGLSICFDLRFSELYAYYRRHCNVMINIANWPASRKEHWLALLQARAIENQFFMIGVNRTGVDGNQLSYEPTSVIYDPLGNLLKPVYVGNEFSIYDVNIQESSNVRAQFPFINDLREELYRNLFKK